MTVEVAKLVLSPPIGDRFGAA